jgi:Domain of unknown function (DUF4337)
MSESYSVHEGVEHAHHAHHALEGSGNRRLRYVPVAAAILAVLAGLSSILSGRMGAHVLSLKNEALLHEVSASDLWNEYQAESLKAHFYDIRAQAADAKVSSSLRTQAQKYRAEQTPLSSQARREEAARDTALAASTVLEIRKSNLEVALAFFEVAIVLTSIAAMIERPILFSLAGILGAIGLFFGLRGVIGF